MPEIMSRSIPDWAPYSLGSGVTQNGPDELLDDDDDDTYMSGTEDSGGFIEDVEWDIPESLTTFLAESGFHISDLITEVELRIRIRTQGLLTVDLQGEPGDSSYIQLEDVTVNSSGEWMWLNIVCVKATGLVYVEGVEFGTWLADSHAAPPGVGWMRTYFAPTGDVPAWDVAEIRWVWRYEMPNLTGLLGPSQVRFVPGKL